MLAVLEFIFEDFWHFIGVACFLMIIAMWSPVSITFITEEHLEGGSEDDN